jgi:hypothetical protein
MNNYWSDVNENLYARMHKLAPIQPQLQFSENNWQSARTQTRRNQFARSKYTNVGKAQRPLKGVERAPSPAPIVSYNSNNSGASTPTTPLSPVNAERARLRALRRQTESPNRAARRKAAANAATAKIQNWKGGRRGAATRRRRA